MNKKFSEELKKNPFYGYYPSRGFLKFATLKIDKIILRLDRFFVYLIKSKNKKQFSLKELKKNIDIVESHYDNPSYFIKDSYSSFLNLFKLEKVKIGLYEQPIRFLLTYILSIYGHCRLSNNKNLGTVIKEYSFLRNKKILIVGSGPSIKFINKELIKKYDHIFLLNGSIVHFIKNKDIHKDKYQYSFYCTDRLRIDQYSKEIAESGISSKRKIFFPDYPYSILRTDLRNQKLSLIGGHKPWNTKYEGYGIGNLLGWHMFYVSTDPINKEKFSKDLKNWISELKYPIYIGYTVAFSCITFVSGFKPKSIDLIGCDFSDTFTYMPINETFDLLKNELIKYDIELSNKSFD